jgi:cell wall-associated NlpC family hydrolase
LVAGSLAYSSPAAADPNLSQVKQQLQALETKLDALNDQYNTANVNLTKVKAEQVTVNKQLAATQARLTALSDQTATYAISAYKGGDVSMMSSMITSGSADTFLDQLTTLDALTGKTAGALKQLKDTKAAQAAQQARVNKLAADAQNLVNTLSASKKGFDSQVSTLKKLRAKLDPENYGADADAPEAPFGAPTTVKFAYAQLNKWYEFAADGPDTYDCSGLTMAAYRQVGINLDHSAHLQYQKNPHISRGAIQAGDLVFFSGLGHVGIAISNSKVIHAPTTGQRVQIANISSMSYYGAARPTR